MDSMVEEARRRLEELQISLQRMLQAGADNYSRTAERDLAEAVAAISRIERGTYGRCERCSGAIGRQRLLALPAARFCIACTPAARET